MLGRHSIITTITRIWACGVQYVDANQKILIGTKNAVAVIILFTSLNEPSKVYTFVYLFFFIILD